MSEVRQARWPLPNSERPTSTTALRCMSAKVLACPRCRSSAMERPAWTQQEWLYPNLDRPQHSWSWAPRGLAESLRIHPAWNACSPLEWR